MDVNKARWIVVHDKVGLVCRNADHPHTEYATWLLIMETARVARPRDTMIAGLLNVACDKCKKRIDEEGK